jgi:hypothetical protein
LLGRRKSTLNVDADDVLARPLEIDGRGKKTAHTYAPSRFVSEPEAKADHIIKRELAEAMERLFRTSKICNAPYGLPSKGWTRLERK